MIEPQTQTREYWESTFTLTDSDIENIYNYFLEAGRPQSLGALARTVMAQRLAEEQNELKRRLSGRAVYQPQNQYQVGDEVVFPAMQYAYGKVVSARQGHNPAAGGFEVIAVEIKGKTREFAARLTDHVLNQKNGDLSSLIADVNVDELYALHGAAVEDRMETALRHHPEFVVLGGQWFIKGLMAEIHVGHLHLAEAVLEVNDGGPLATPEIMQELELDPGVDPAVQQFSLNYALLQDGRFDEVAPAGKVAWFLRRMEPEAVKQAPTPLQYQPIPYDRALLAPQVLLLERELDDEWSDIEAGKTAQAVVLALIAPHRVAGTLPLSARTRPLFPLGKSSRLQITFIDEHTGDAIPAWVVKENRYIYGFKEWYESNAIPVGGFISLKPGENGAILIDYDRRRPQREWVRLAMVEDGRIKFDLQKRNVGCGYDDLLIVGTDQEAAVEGLRRRLDANQWSLASVIGEVFPELARLNPQNTVHAKTIYSALNMVKRTPPAPLFAELVRHPAFQPVGDHYWTFDSSRLSR